MNIAITAPPIKWIGKRFSIKTATAAIITDNVIPDKNFKTFII